MGGIAHADKEAVGQYDGLTDARGAGDELLAEARGYVRVRALGMPAAMVFMVLQVSFLGGRDWRPPTAAAVVACIANLMADLLLVAK